MRPIELHGPDEFDRAQPIDLTVALRTDIWFPRVVGLDDGPDDEPQMFANDTLAACRTPRFNRFLGALHAKVLELGGTWELMVDGVTQNYAPWMLVDGIRLTP